MTAPPPVRFALLVFLLAALAACRGREDAPVDAARGVRLPDPAGASASLALDARGRVWVADSGRLVVLDTAGAVLARAELGTTAAARAVGMDTAALYLRAGSRLLAVAPDSVRVRARRSGVREGAFAPDPRGGDAYLATSRGGVLGLRAGSLRPRWGWPERGPAGTALAVSPLGDRVYLALAGDAAGNEDRARILTRDAQSGRILATTPVPGPVRRLLAGTDGTLYALAGEGRGAVLALRPGPEGLTQVWEKSVRALELGDSARLLVSPAGARLALVAPEGGGSRVRVLDGATGEVVGSEEGVVDAAFAPDGRLYLLGRRAVRVARVR